MRLDDEALRAAVLEAADDNNLVVDDIQWGVPTRPYASRRETVAGNFRKATNRALPERYLFGRFADLRSD